MPIRPNGSELSRDSARTTPPGNIREYGSCELRFEPCAALISVTRRFVRDFYQELLPDPETVAVLALATHELLENTVKYSNDGRASLLIAVDGAGANLLVRVQTRNAARPEHVTELERRFACMRSAADRFAYYHAEIEESVRASSGSGLGLARIFAETEMDLSLTVTGGDVEITAVRHLELGGTEEERSCNA